MHNSFNMRYYDIFVLILCKLSIIPLFNTLFKHFLRTTQATETN